MNETTDAEWIAFLQSLPPAGRVPRLPGATRQRFTVALTELADGDYPLTLGQDAPGDLGRQGRRPRDAGHLHLRLHHRGRSEVRAEWKYRPGIDLYLACTRMARRTRRLYDLLSGEG